MNQTNIVPWEFLHPQLLNKYFVRKRMPESKITKNKSALAGVAQWIEHGL